MNKRSYRDILDSAAADAFSHDINLLPEILARLERRTLMIRLRSQPRLLIFAILLALTLLTGVAYAIGKLTGFIPGIGFVETSALRVLAEPVSVTRDGITVTIEQVIVDSKRTVIVYKTKGLTIEAANSKGEGGGPFGSQHFLRLPDGTILKEQGGAGYGGTPEPLVNSVQTVGGWPNYVWRLVYPPVPADVNELTLVIPVLQNMPIGAAPENWEIPFHLKPAPPEMTFAPITILPTISTSTIETTETGKAVTPSPSNVATLNGFTFQLDNVVELEDGFVFTGHLSWDASAFPTGKGLIAEAITPTLTDASGQQIPIEEVQLDAPYREYEMAWSYRTNRKAFAGPLTLSIFSIKTNVAVPPVDLEIDFGSNPQVGQTIEVNRDFTVNGHTIRLLSVSLLPLDSCQGVNVNFNFSTDIAGVFASISDAVPTEPVVCSGGGGGGPVDPTIFTAGIIYKNMPTGVRRFSVEFWMPYPIEGPWQVRWNPPLSFEPTPTPEPEACLDLNKWNQVTGRNDALPSGVGGKIVRTINEGGPLPAIYVSDLDGSNLQKIGIGAWPSLSNNGTRLVYSAQDGLRLVDLSTGQSSAFGVDGYHILWSPDNTRMMFTNTFNMYVVNADGSGLQRINIPSGQVFAPVGWLPDNQTIVYSELSGDGFVLKTYNLQSGEIKELFTIHNKAGYGAISPDGRWLVFADRTFGETNWGIFISRLDGSERKLVVEPEVPTAFMPVWGPDSQWLIVNTRDVENRNVPMLVNPFTCETFSLSQLNGMVEGWSR